MISPRSSFPAAARMAAALALTAVLVLTLLAASASVVVAGTQGSCDPSDNNKTKLFENIIDLTDDGNDKLWSCSGTSDLSAINHTKAGNCNDGTPWGVTTWNDCVSSWNVFVGSNRRLCYYKNANHGNLMAYYIGSISGTRYDHPSGGNDTLSSVKITGSGVSCP